ncbi:MAG: hypothetical protein Q7T55_04220, partial [Solirubrobacteraceae bacterium]|nr:hypothetical protein [Solirubrobacteraceae bacterium]
MASSFRTRYCPPQRGENDDSDFSNEKQRGMTKESLVDWVNKKRPAPVKKVSEREVVKAAASSAPPVVPRYITI